MQTHVKNYLIHYGLYACDTINCQWCGDVAVDIHHIEPRSKFGNKRKSEQDHWSNLIALCRDCHVKAHANIITKDELFTIISNQN